MRLHQLGRGELISVAKVKDTLVKYFGPTVRLQRVRAAGVEGCRVVVREGGEERIWAQSFERGPHGVEAEAALLAIRGRVASLNRG